ncbi:MAG: hypothetical protein ACR2FH_05395 [Caulobacteraceae bacterium]
MLKALCSALGDAGKLIASILRFYRGRRPAANACCACPPALKKPDPFLYSQAWLTSQGYPVTWDNPDIFIYQNGVLVDPHDLHASTTYTVVARIWNNSADIPVVDMPVVFSYLSFGMGAQSNPIGTVTTDLGVIGLPGCPAFPQIAWTTPAALGHYCLQVLCQPPDDSNWLNNMGQRNADVAQAHSPAAFSFAVGNHGRKRPRTVRFTLDSYALPPLPPCDARPKTIGKTAPPVPEGWTVVLTPDRFILGPDEERQVQAAITPPPGFSGSMPINVHAWDAAGLIGGVTLIVEAT